MSEENKNEKVHEGQIVEAHPVRMDEPQTVEMALQRAEQHIQKRRGLVKLIAKNIDPRDVVIYGKPPKETVHYAKNACKQILSWIEADITDVEIKETRGFHTSKGPYVIFEAEGLLTIGGRRVSIFGSRATYDDFFGRAYGEELPLEEIDIPSVRLAAITNMWNHALEDAGLKPSLEELKNAGLDLTKASYVNFKERKDAAETDSAQPASQSQNTSQQAQNGGNEPKGEKISEPQAKRLFAIGKNLGFTIDEYRSALQTQFGVSSDRDLPRAVYQLAEKWLTDNRKN
jgi:hypothetical protein